MIRLLQGLFSSMSLERKTLLFFGSALIVLMFGAFLVVEKLGRELVKNTTRTRARDFSAAEVLRIHHDAIWSSGESDEETKFKRAKLEGLRDSLLDENLESNIKYEILSLGKEGEGFENLPTTPLPEDPQEIARLEELENKYRK